MSSGLYDNTWFTDWFLAHPVRGWPESESVPVVQRQCPAAATGFSGSDQCPATGNSDLRSGAGRVQGTRDIGRPPACKDGHERPGGDHVQRRHEHQPRCLFESPRSSGNRHKTRDEGFGSAEVDRRPGDQVRAMTWRLLKPEN